jgi:hypothetical protein
MKPSSLWKFALLVIPALGIMGQDLRRAAVIGGALVTGADSAVELIAERQVTNLVQWSAFAAASTNGAQADLFDAITATNPAGSAAPSWTNANGGSLAFNGTNQYLIAGIGTNTIHGKSGLAIAFWWTATAINNGDKYNNLLFVSRLQAALAGQWVNITSNRILAGGRSFQGDSFQEVITGTIALSNTPTLLTVSWNVPGDTIAIYANASLLTNGAVTFGSNVFWTSGTIAMSNHTWCGDNLTASRYCAGRLGETYFWTNTISAAQVSNLWETTRGRYGQ